MLIQWLINISLFNYIVFLVSWSYNDSKLNYRIHGPYYSDILQGKTDITKLRYLLVLYHNVIVFVHSLLFLMQIQLKLQSRGA